MPLYNLPKSFDLQFLCIPSSKNRGSVTKPGGYLSMSYVMLTIIHSDDRHEWNDKHEYLKLSRLKGGVPRRGEGVLHKQRVTLQYISPCGCKTPPPYGHLPFQAEEFEILLLITLSEVNEMSTSSSLKHQVSRLIPFLRRKKAYEWTKRNVL